MKRVYKLITFIAMLVLIVGVMKVCANAAELKAGIGTVTASISLNLRAAPTTDSAILTAASHGDHVVVIRKTGDWYFVDYNLSYGYMYAKYLQVEQYEDVDLGSASVNPAVASLHSGPSSSERIVTTACGGEQVKISGFDHGWYKVTCGDSEGYIRSDLVRLTESPSDNHELECEEESDDNDDDSYIVYCSDVEIERESYDDMPQEPAPMSLGEQIVQTAQGYIGCPYVFGGTTPSGFDCSGFVQYVYALYGVSLYRTADVQLNNGYSVSTEDLRPGDLVFFAHTYNTNAAASHVGIYIGDGKFVHAANSRIGVTISDLDNSYYVAHYVGARRIF